MGRRCRRAGNAAQRYGGYILVAQLVEPATVAHDVLASGASPERPSRRPQAPPHWRAHESQFHGECLGQADQGALGRGVGAHARHDLVAQARCHGRYRGRFAGTQQRQQLAYQDMRGCQVYRHQVIPCRQRDLGQGTARQYRIAAEEHECIDVPPGAPDLSDRLDDGLLFKRVKADVAGAGNAAVGADGLGQVQHGDVHAMGQRLGDEFASDAAAAAGDYHVRARFRPSQLSSCAIIISPWESRIFRG